MDTTKVPLGKTVGPIESYCDPDEVAAFALAINDNNPLYQDGRAVPPTYAFVPGLQPFLATVALPSEAMKDGFPAGHGEHDLSIHRMPKPGTVLRTTAELSAVAVNKVGMNVFTRLITVDEADQVVYEQYWSTMQTGPVEGGNQGRELADHTFPESARSSRVGTMVLTTTTDQTFRYAGASGDRAILHVSDQAANAMLRSDRGKILQGACTLSIASRALVALAAGGEPARIRRIAVRFARSVYPGDELSVSVYDVGPLPEGGHAYAFEASVDGTAVLRNGRVEVSANAPE